MGVFSGVYFVIDCWCCCCWWPHLRLGFPFSLFKLNKSLNVRLSHEFHRGVPPPPSSPPPRRRRASLFSSSPRFRSFRQSVTHSSRPQLLIAVHQSIHFLFVYWRVCRHVVRPIEWGIEMAPWLTLDTFKLISVFWFTRSIPGPKLQLLLPQHL